MNLPPEAEDASFAGQEIEDEELANATFVRCTFRGASLAGIVPRRCSFQACDFTLARLNGSEHEGTDFANAVFENANLFGARFVDCRLVGASFTAATLTGLTVEGGDWSYVSLRGHDLTGVDLRKLRLY